MQNRFAEAQGMILEATFGLSLVLKVSLDTTIPISVDPSVWTQMSVPQKDAVLLPLVQKATDCIVRRVSANGRYKPNMSPEEINNLIVDSITACRGPVRAMIHVHDRLYGDGSGEAFLLGPYLDVLPAAVIRQVKVRTQVK
jgi:hypothetical protein